MPHAVQLDDLHKKLLTCMQLGIRIETTDGHRWLEFNEYNNNPALDNQAGAMGIIINSKVYGGITECLDRVDHLLEMMGMPKLLDNWPWNGNDRDIDMAYVTNKDTISDKPEDRVERFDLKGRIRCKKCDGTGDINSICSTCDGQGLVEPSGETT